MELVGETHKVLAPVRAAQYVRMSTDHQRYSTENQSAAIQRYAAQRGFFIVRTYADEGRSGLSLHGRYALKQLIEDIRERRADYSVVLVYDVSRWGRFQDADESAHYEFICREAGISVCYCAEEFENDGSLYGTLIKNLKRAMAAEFSRELSVRVHTGHCKLASLGFHQGGMAGYGLRRQLIDENRKPKGPLEFGQRKSLQTDRVVLIPGPRKEIETVRRIYRLFAYKDGNAYGIAKLLNAEGKKNQFGRPWRNGLVYSILHSEKYAGDYVYNRESFTLGQFRGVNKPEHWVKVPNAFEAVVGRDLVHAVQAERKRRATPRSDEEMIRHLSDILSKEGRLSADVINKQKGVPSSEMYRIRFGTLSRAYELAGFKPRRDSRSLSVSRFIRQLRPRFIDEVIEVIQRAGATVVHDCGLLRVNDEVSLLVTIARCYHRGGGRLEWRVRLKENLKPDITIAARMDEENERCVDYFILPHFSVGYRSYQGYVSLENGTFKWEAYRPSSLAPLLVLFSRTEVLALRHVADARVPGIGSIENIEGDMKPRGTGLLMAAAPVPIGTRRVCRRSRKLIQRGAVARSWLLFVEGAFRKLLSEDHFARLLHAEGMTTLPRFLAERLTNENMPSAATEISSSSESAEEHSVDDILHLVITIAYASRLIQNKAIVRYIGESFPEMLKELLLLLAAASVDRHRTQPVRPIESPVCEAAASNVRQ